MDQAELYARSSCAVEDSEINLALKLRDELIGADIKRKFREDESVEIAELSVGGGQTAQTLLSLLPAANLTCVDISQERLNALEQALTPRFSNRMPKLIICNFDTDFSRIPAEKFDVVVALDVLEHVFDVFNFIDNCHRLLKEGGRLYIRVPNIGYFKHRIGLLLGQLPVTASYFGPKGDLSAWRLMHGWDGGHLHLFTIPILKQLLSEGGFSIIDCSDPGSRFSQFRKAWPNLLIANSLVIAQKKAS